MDFKAAAKMMIEDLKQKYLKELYEGKLSEEELKQKYAILFLPSKK